MSRSKWTVLVTGDATRVVAGGGVAVELAVLVVAVVSCAAEARVEVAPRMSHRDCRTSRPR